MADKKKDEAAPAPVLIRERERSIAGGGDYWRERVRPLQDGEPIPDGARVVEGVEPHDWQPAPAE